MTKIKSVIVLALTKPSEVRNEREYLNEQELRKVQDKLGNYLLKLGYGSVMTLKANIQTTSLIEND